MIAEVVEQLRVRLPAGSGLRADLGDRRRVVYLGSRWVGRGVYAVFTGRTSTPSVVVKVDFLDEHQGRLRAEWESLNDLTGHPALEGRVPRPLALFPVKHALVLAQRGLPGVPMNVVLRRRLRPGMRSTERDHRALLEWMKLLHTASAEDSVTDVEPEAVVDRVARAIKPTGLSSTAILERFAAVAAATGPLRMPLRPQHGDLGTSNILLSRGRAGVIDWEGGHAQAPPLQDMLIFLGQYARAVPAHRQLLLGWRQSFERAFVSEDWFGRLTMRTWKREVAGLGLPADASGYLLAVTMADLATKGGTAALSWNPTWRSMWAWRLATYLADAPRQTGS